jgi:transcription-repair coupling factor (superfamily II helicase)
MYKRLANAQNEDALRDLQVEMIDRFGLLPDAIKNLFRVTQIKICAETIGIIKLEANSRGGKVEFASDTKVDPLQIVKLVQSQPRIYKLEGANQLKFTLDLEATEKRIQAAVDLLEYLTPKH